LLQQFPSVTAVIFLGSETEEGKLATNVNFETLRKIWPGGQVLQKIIPGLERRFTAITPALEEILRNCDAARADRVRFNVTGGFKGVIPSVTHLVSQHTGWAIYYQYERLTTVAEVFFARDAGSGTTMQEKPVSRGKVVDPGRVRG